MEAVPLGWRGSMRDPDQDYRVGYDRICHPDYCHWFQHRFRLALENKMPFAFLLNIIPMGEAGSRKHVSLIFGSS